MNILERQEAIRNQLRACGVETSMHMVRNGSDETTRPNLVVIAQPQDGPAAQFDFTGNFKADRVVRKVTQAFGLAPGNA